MRGDPTFAEQLAVQVSANDASRMNATATCANLCGAQPVLRANPIDFDNRKQSRGTCAALIGRTIHTPPQSTAGALQLLSVADVLLSGRTMPGH